MTHYALIGGGRLARHMRHYLTLSDLAASGWTRDRLNSFNSHSQIDSEQRLRATIEPATHVLLLVTDTAIPKILKTYPFLHEKQLVHCSGAFSLPGVIGAHPLMTFGPDLYDLEHYQRIPFMIDSGHAMADVLPGLSNPHHQISVDQKARYHALCVMAGNFSQILWSAAVDGFESMGLPPEALNPYLHQVVDNFTAAPDLALTGPLSRNDTSTIDRNLQSLEGSPLQPVYQSFIELHRARSQSDSGQDMEREMGREIAV